MNIRSIRFLVGFFLCAVGLYLLYVNMVKTEMILPSYGMRIPAALLFVGGFGGIFTGIRLLQQAITEPLR